MRKSGLRVNASRSPGYSTFSAAGELPRRFSSTNLARRPPSSADVDVGDPPAPRYTSSAVRGRCAAESAARAWRRSRALGAKSRRFRGFRRRWLSSVSSRRSSRRSSSRYSSVCMKRNTSSETSASRVAPAGALHTSSAASSARGACSEKQ